VMGRAACSITNGKTVQYVATLPPQRRGWMGPRRWICTDTGFEEHGRAANRLEAMYGKHTMTSGLGRTWAGLQAPTLRVYNPPAPELTGGCG